MSRIGREPIEIPKGVEVTIAGGNITVKGPKGTLVKEMHPATDAKVEGNQILVTLKPGREQESNFHGMMRALIANMVEGVSNGFQKKLEMIGVGYRAAVKGTNLDLQIGVSHPTLIPIPKGLKVEVEKNTTIIITGANNQELGQFAATVRSKKPPEVYQGKGIRYSGEYVRKKAGKAAAKTA